MRTKLAILLFSILIAVIAVPLQAQIPTPDWWIYDGDSLYSIINNVWVTGDSIHFKFAAFDSLSGINLDSLGRIQIDTLTVNDSLNVGGFGLFEDDVLIKNNLTVEDTIRCDYYKGLSPMYFLSSSYFGYMYADTAETGVTIAPSVSATDYFNTEGYWEIIAGPDSLEWAITANIYATTDHILDFVIDETDTMFVFFNETVNNSDYRLLRGTSVGWSSVGVIGGLASTTYLQSVAMCRGGGDSIFVAFANGPRLCAAVWDGSSFSAIDTVGTGSYAGCNMDIARESNGTLHYIGCTSASTINYYTGTLGSWSAGDPVTTSCYRYGASLVLDGTSPHVIVGTTSPGGTGEYYSPAGGWDYTAIWTPGGIPIVGDAAISSSGIIYAALKDRNTVTRIYENSGGWAQMGGDLWSFNTLLDRPQIALNSLGNPAIVQDDHPGINVAIWMASAWDDIPPTTGDGAAIIDIAFDSNDNIHIVTRNGANNYLLYGTRQVDPGLNTGHRNGALLIQANLENSAADIYIKTDSTVHIECDSLIIEGPARVTDYAITTPATKIIGLVSGLTNTYFWSGSIPHDSVTAAATSEDIKLISNFPARYKILEIFIDVTEVWDDAAGPMSACDLSIGWTGAGYADLMNSQDIYTAVTQIGDAAGELNYTSVQSGIRASWSAATDLYLRFVATGANLATLTSGALTVYVVYQVF